MPRILLLFCGGTIAMHKDATTGALVTAGDTEMFFRLEPRIRELADIEVTFVENIDSTNATPATWEKIVSVVAEHYDTYDGFVVTFGTNSMAYASSAVSFPLAGIGKPVVFTGAQIPVESIATDGRNNLVNAVKAACLPIGGVFVVFGSKLMLGCRAKKVSESELDAFASFNDSDFGNIAIDITVNKKTNVAQSGPLTVRNGFDPRVLVFTLVPGLSSSTVIREIDARMHGIILRAYGSGDVPYDFIPMLEYAQEKRVPIVITTQCRGSTMMGLNDVGYRALMSNVIQAYDMSMESMSTKLMWLLAQGTPYEEMKTEMERSYCGEVKPEKGKVFLTR